MKTIYLIPPSESKTPWWSNSRIQTSFKLILPLEIAKNATPIDLKCKDKKYQEAINLNHNIKKSPTISAIHRYIWVMYNAIDYRNMDINSQKYFDEHILIISGMYWVLRPQDLISDYKLPISTKWLKTHRWEYITDSIIKYCHKNKITHITSLLPLAHQKFINTKLLEKAKIDIYIAKFEQQNTKITHQIKKVKWNRLRDEIIKSV